MKFLVNKRPFTKDNKPDQEGFTPVKEPNPWLQMIFYFLIAMLAVGIVFLLKKNIVHIKTRAYFSMAELPAVWIPLIQGILTVLVARYLIKLITVLVVTKGKGGVTGFSLRPPSLFATTTEPVSKLPRIAMLLIPYIVLTIAFLLIHKNLSSPAKYKYFWLFLPYLNAAFSCGDIYNAFLVALKTPKNSVTKEWNALFFYKDAGSNKEEKSAGKDASSLTIEPIPKKRNSSKELDKDEKPFSKGVTDDELETEKSTLEMAEALEEETQL